MATTTMRSSPLSSHSPLCFGSKPGHPVETMNYTANRLQCISNAKIRIEAARDEPRLRNLLGHIAIYDGVREWNHSHKTTSRYVEQFSEPQLKVESIDESADITDANELHTYLHHIPSFQDFQAAIQLQLAAIADITAATAQLTVEEYEGDGNSDNDSDYDSYDGDWNEEYSDAGTESEGSDTDVELMETDQQSECDSPTSAKGFEDVDLSIPEPWTFQASLSLRNSPSQP